MSKVDLSKLEQPPEPIPQITQPRGEGDEMQRLLDRARMNQQETMNHGAPAAPAKVEKSEEENEAEVDEVTKRLTEFFDIKHNYHSLFLKDEKKGLTWEFVVKPLESSHFILGSLKVLDPTVMEKDPQGYMVMFKEMFQYFLRSLVCIKKGKDKITAEYLARGVPSYNPGYYSAISESLTKILNFGQITTVVLEYTKFFNGTDAPAIEKKTN